MTDAQRFALLRKARKHLQRTKQGYAPEGSEWKAALAALDKLATDLKPSPALALGPVWTGGKGVLSQDLTHATTGIPLYPAFDDAFNQGRVIVAPEDIEVTRQSSASPGEAFYATGKSKIRYWFGHLDRGQSVGTKFKKGDAIGRVAANSIGGGPHVHVGLNVELLWGVGKELKHHTNYTHGAPKVGTQLAAAGAP